MKHCRIATDCRCQRSRERNVQANFNVNRSFPPESVMMLKRFDLFLRRLSAAAVHSSVPKGQHFELAYPHSDLQGLTLKPTLTLQ